MSVSEVDWSDTLGSTTRTTTFTVLVETTPCTELAEPSSASPAYEKVRPPGAEGRGPLVLNTSRIEAEVEAGEPYRAEMDAVGNLITRPPARRSAASGRPRAP